MYNEIWRIMSVNNSVTSSIVTCVVVSLPPFLLASGTHDIHALILGRAITGEQAFTAK